MRLRRWQPQSLAAAPGSCPPLKASMEAGTEAGAPGAGAGRARPPRRRPARTRAQPLSGCPQSCPRPNDAARSPHGPPGAAGQAGGSGSGFSRPEGPASRSALRSCRSGPQPPARPRLRLPIRGRFRRTAPAESVLKRQRAPPGSSSPTAPDGWWVGWARRGGGWEGRARARERGRNPARSRPRRRPALSAALPPSLPASPAPSLRSPTPTFPPPPPSGGLARLTLLPRGGTLSSPSGRTKTHLACRPRAARAHLKPQMTCFARNQLLSGAASKFEPLARTAQDE